MNESENYYFLMANQANAVVSTPKDDETTNVKNDPVNHPSHYTSHPSGIECIDIAKWYDFCIGNCIKYIWRAGLKKSATLSDKEKELEDLKKARWYLDKEIQEKEKELQ